MKKTPRLLKPLYPFLWRRAKLKFEPINFTGNLIAAALKQVNRRVIFDDTYRKITYPGGDVPPHIGTSADLIIRSYRDLGVDLQKEIYEDMCTCSHPYSDTMFSREPDACIDHRRIFNMEIFFRRKGITLPITMNPQDYKAADLISWLVPPDLPHIGIITNHRSKDGKRFLVVHNLGMGPKLEDVLFEYQIRGHFRYYGPII